MTTLISLVLSPKKVTTLSGAISSSGDEPAPTVESTALSVGARWAATCFNALCTVLERSVHRARAREAARSGVAHYQPGATFQPGFGRRISPLIVPGGYQLNLCNLKIKIFLQFFSNCCSQESVLFKEALANLQNWRYQTSSRVGKLWTLLDQGSGYVLIIDRYIKVKLK